MTNESPGEEVLDIARSILRYLETRPEAKDTLDGIAQWWLIREWRERKLAAVERAVSFLVSEDLILRTSGTGLPPFYQLNVQKGSEISKILKSP